MQGIQIASMPMDPELASGKANGKASKLLKLGEGEVCASAIEALAKFEQQMGKSKRPYIDYREESVEEWDSSDGSEEN